jgi:hypothetical protein
MTAVITGLAPLENEGGHVSEQVTETISSLLMLSS